MGYIGVAFECAKETDHSILLTCVCNAAEALASRNPACSEMTSGHCGGANPSACIPDQQFISVATECKKGTDEREPSQAEILCFCNAAEALASRNLACSVSELTSMSKLTSGQCVDAKKNANPSACIPDQQFISVATECKKGTDEREPSQAEILCF